MFPGIVKFDHLGTIKANTEEYKRLSIKLKLQHNLPIWKFVIKFSKPKLSGENINIRFNAKRIVDSSSDENSKLPIEFSVYVRRSKWTSLLSGLNLSKYSLAFPLGSLSDMWLSNEASINDLTSERIGLIFGVPVSFFIIGTLYNIVVRLISQK